MERCAALLIEDPESLRGRWLASFPGRERLYVELGCGKGRFTADTAETMPDTLYIAVERVPDAMILAMEKIERRGIENVRFIDGDAKLLNTMFSEGEADRFYINFCDPWPKKKQFKRRLTAPGFLALYRQILKPEGEIWFKTDNRDLFDWSEEQLLACGWQVSEVTRDLHGNGAAGIMTDYEKKFYGEGKPICRLTARAK
jgi:tRNA (guanine-N7-)-methyltransferase